ncbi:alpha amylase [Phellopilus nigrolimitatus]|nr:alpha amylase [Phellopilus nigrolimitatus]
MDILWETIDLLIDTFWPWSASLQKMSLHARDREENPLMMQFYTWESKGDDTTSWWKHFEQEIPRLKELGVSHVWLPPLQKAATGKASVGYDVYDLWDLGEFEQKGTVTTRWGTKEELLRACSAAKSNGIEIIIDAVLNHKCGGDRKETVEAIPVDPKNRLVPSGQAREIEAWTAFDFPGRGEKYSTMKWDYRHFSGVDWDAKSRMNDIFYINGPGRKGWSNFVANELGNYDYLLGCDIDHRQPDVKEDLLNWGSWILQVTGATGFRMDAMKHYDRRFLREFVERTKQTLGMPKLFVVSEFWTGDIALLEKYTRLLRGQSSFFDVPLHYNLHNASMQGPHFDLRNILKDTLVERRPWDAVTFVDNHDTEIGQSLESWVDSSFKLQAYALILLRTDGFPCVFYGDLYPDQEWYDPRIGAKLELLVKARKNFAYGSITDYFQYRDCIGFARAGDERHSGCAVVLRSGIAPRSPQRGSADELGKEIRMKVNVAYHQVRTPLASVLTVSLTIYVPEARCSASGISGFFGGDSRRVLVSSDGSASFPCPEGSVAVWVVETTDIDFAFITNLQTTIQTVFTVRVSYF